MSKQSSEYFRLERLVDAYGGFDRPPEATLDLLRRCIRERVCAYYPVPDGMVAASYKLEKRATAMKSSSKPDSFPIRKAPAPLFIRLGRDALQRILNKGSYTLESFTSGGLEAVEDRLIPVDVEYGVIQKGPAVSVMQSLILGDVPTSVEAVRRTHVVVKAEDVWLSEQDMAKIRSSIGVQSIPDKWGHKEAAPSVFFAYKVSKTTGDRDIAFNMLYKNGNPEVFVKSVAGTVADMINRDVGSFVMKHFMRDKISSNEMGKDYSDPTLSERMSLLLLATDCWIHDRPILAEIKKRQYEIAEEGKKKAKGIASERGKTNAMAEAAQKREYEVAEAKARLLMPGKLDAYLMDIGFSENQAKNLYRVITEAKLGSRHRVAGE